MRPYWSSTRDELFRDHASCATGLAQEEAARRLVEQGENVVADIRRSTAWALLFRQIRSPLVLILVFAAFISILVQEWTEASIILAIVLASTILGFTQEYMASQAVDRLRGQLSLRTRVLRDGECQTIEARHLVPGDVIMLSAGNLIPADAVVLEAQDFLVTQAALTGESFPVEKSPEPTPPDAPIARRTNAVYLGTSVRSGTATALIVRTGTRTELATLATALSQGDVETDFAKGIRNFGYLLTQIMAVIVIAVFTANLLLHRPLTESLLFAVALAVGLSPELLPAIISVTLSAGARKMAEQGVIVRRLEAIENLGSVDVLCTDKTGTITKGIVDWTAAVDPAGTKSQRVYDLAAANAWLETGIENPLDAAIVEDVRRRIPDYSPPPKIDEIPYDFVRKRLTIVVAADACNHTIIAKGAVDAILSCCTHIATPSGPKPLDDGALEIAHAFNRSRGAEGFRALGVASKSGSPKPHYDRADESGMIFEGFLLFFDPLKDEIEATISSLLDLGIKTKIITGDNRHVAAHVAQSIGLQSSHLVTGEQLNEMHEDALARIIADTDVYAEVDPQQKERIVRALQGAGHAVAYMGDGINDAPALKFADVGVSVDSAADVARETADIVLLRRDLNVLRQGVIDGRRTFANTIKYIQMTTSANFGNMISMSLATVFVPFLPLLAKQILLNNFLSDIPAMFISTDNVDPESLAAPQRWNIRRIWSFMLVFGLTSTVFDIAAFVVLLHVFDTGEELFQSTWFVVSVLTELAVVMVLRTHLPAWRSKPSTSLLIATIAIALVAVCIPYFGPAASIFGFVPLPAKLLFAAAAIVTLYVATTELVKWRYFAGTRGEIDRT